MNEMYLPLSLEILEEAAPAAGRERSFERFVLEQRQQLVCFLRQRLPTEEDAQDAAQESMVRLLGYRDDQPPANWRPLLYRIAVNVATDHLRRARCRHRDEHVSYEEAFHAAPSDELPHDEQLARQQLMDRLWQIVRTLPLRTQEVYVLNRVEGMSYQQVARHCGISASAVEKHISRALLALRNGLGEAAPGAL